MRIATLALVFTGWLFGQSYTLSTFAGLGLPMNVAANSVSLGSVAGVAIDAAGNVYFTSGNTILRIDAATRLLSVVAGNGTQGFSGDGGPATAAQLNQPSALAVDSSGNLYIAEYGRVREVSGGIITTIAGNGTPGATGDNGPAISAQVAPLGLAVDSSGNLYLANAVGGMLLPGGPFGGGPFVSSDSIRKISRGTIATIAGNGTCCNVSADNVPATSTALYELSGIVVDSTGNIYLASGADPDNAGAVRKIANGILSTVAGGASATANSGSYTGPATNAKMGILGGLVLDSAGNLYVADETYNVVRKISNGTIANVAGYGPSGYGGDGGPATGARLSAPQGIALDSAGNLYIADSGNYAIREVSGGIISTAAGNGQISFSGDNGPATAAQFNMPAGVAVYSSGNLYIADQDNNRIRKVSNGIITTVAGNGGQSLGGDGGPATSAILFVPEGVAVDTAGDIFIADTANARIREVSNGIITTVAGGGSGVNGFGDGGPATSAFLAPPQGVAVDSAGDIYILDSSHNRVREVSNGIINTVVGTGTAGYNGDGGLAVNAELNQPSALAVDAAGDLYIADGRNYRVRKISGGIVTTVAGIGTSGASGDGGPATSAQLNYPAGLAFDAAGNLYISDLNAIRKVSNGIITTIASDGIASSGIAVDSAGNVYFSEPSANRVRLLRPNASACTGLIGTTTRNIGNAGGNLSIDIAAGDNCTWMVQGLPSWITYSGSGGTGNASITVVVAPNTGSPRTATFIVASTAVTVIQGTVLTLTTPSPLPPGTTGAAYSASFAATGGLAPYTWSIHSGALPPGLMLSSAGAIAGTPSVGGTYNFVVLVTDSGSELISQTYALTVIAPGGAIPPGTTITHALPTNSQHVFVDPSGNVYSAADGSGTLPVSPGAAQPQSNGGMTCNLDNTVLCPNAYVTKSDATGKLVVGTFLGGPTTSYANGITADGAGNIYIVGGGPVPVTANAAIATQPPGGAFAAKLSPDGTKFLYVTYLPAQIGSIQAAPVVDAAGNLYIAGTTLGAQPIVVGLSADGSTILYTKVLASEGAVYAITVDPAGDLVAAGATSATDLPVTPGALQATLPGQFDGFVARLDPTGAVLAATYLGGDFSDPNAGVQTDSAGNIYVAGMTTASNFPTTADSLWPAPPVPLWFSGNDYGFVAKLSPDVTSLLYSTFVMGLSPVLGLAVNAAGEAYVTGATLTGFPVTASAPQPCFSASQDGYLAHISADGSTLLDATYVFGALGYHDSAMALAADGSVYLDVNQTLAQVRFGDATFAAPACLTPTVLNAASQTPSAVPGEFVTLVGWGIGPQVPTSPPGVQVFFDGVPAPVLYAQSEQVNAQAPFSISGTTVVKLKYNGTTFGPFSMPVSFADPEILRRQIGVSTQALAYNQDNTVNGPSNPAPPGSVVYFFGTGFGNTSPGCTAGGPNVPAAANLAGVTVTANNGAAPVQYAGSAPSLPCGIAQINMQVAANATSGPYGVNLAAQMGSDTVVASTSSTIVVK